MADPEFQNMLRDYMEEMQDPAQRAVSERPFAFHLHACVDMIPHEVCLVTQALRFAVKGFFRDNVQYRLCGIRIV